MKGARPGSRPVRLLITGDSHCGVLKNAHASLVRDNQAPQAHFDVRALGAGRFMPTRFFEDRGDHVEIIEPEYRERFERLPPPGEAFDFLGFSGPLHSVRLWYLNDWRSHTPWATPGKAGPEPTHLLSEAVLRKIVEDDTREMLCLLGLLQRHVKVFVVEPPRPFRHNPSLQRFGAERLMALHRRHHAQVSEQLAALGVPVVGIDPTWVDEEGYMRPEYRSKRDDDPHHGNLDFGRQMVARIDAFARAAV